MSYAAFGRSIGIQRQNAETKVFAKRSIDTDLLAEISEKLDHNFFNYYKNFDASNENDYKTPILGSVAVEIKGRVKKFNFTFNE